LHPVVADVFADLEGENGRNYEGDNLETIRRRTRETNGRKPFDEEKVLVQELTSQLWPVDKLDPHVVKRARTILSEKANNHLDDRVGRAEFKIERDISDEEAIEMARAMQMRFFAERAVKGATYPGYAARALEPLAGCRVTEMDGDRKMIDTRKPDEPTPHRIVAGPEQFRVADEQVVDAYNTFRAFLDLKGTKLTLDQADAAEFKRRFPNLRLNSEGLAYLAGGNDQQRRDNLQTAERDYLMVREKLAERLQSELGGSEPLTENQLRRRLKEVEAENRQLHGDLELEQDNRRSAEQRAEAAERNVGIAEVEEKGLRLAATEAKKKGEANVEALKRDVNAKLAEIQALLAGARFGNKGEVIEGAQGAITELLKSLK